MSAETRGPDRIYLSRHAAEVVARLREANYMELNEGAANRSEIFLFAMAFGAGSVPTKLDGLNEGGWVLEKSIESQTRALMYALFISKLEGGELDEIMDKGRVYAMAQEYANTGFEVLENFLDTKKDGEAVWDILADLDRLYTENLAGRP